MPKWTGVRQPAVVDQDRKSSPSSYLSAGSGCFSRLTLIQTFAKPDRLGRVDTVDAQKIQIQKGWNATKSWIKYLWVACDNACRCPPKKKGAHLICDRARHHLIDRLGLSAVADIMGVAESCLMESNQIPTLEVFPTKKREKLGSPKNLSTKWRILRKVFELFLNRWSLEVVFSTLKFWA